MPFRTFSSVSAGAAGLLALSPTALAQEVVEATPAPARTVGLRDLAPRALTGWHFLGLEPWQWLGLAAAVLIAVVAAGAFTSLAFAVARRLAARSKSTLDDELVRLLRGPVRLVVGVALFRLSAVLLDLPPDAVGILTMLVTALGAVALAWATLRLVDLAARMATVRLTAGGQVNLVAAIPLARRVGKVVIIAFAFVLVLQNAGFNVGALLAGLGIGGIAVALAAQKTIEDVFGGVTLVTARPVRVGDTCRFNGRTGTIEEIGLRATRIRTQERSLITIPNAAFAASHVENLTERDQMLFSTTLGLRYETTADQLRAVLVDLRRLLLSHPMVDAEPARVRFAAYGASSLDIQVFAYVRTRVPEEFLAVQEDILLRMMDVVEQAGTGFAFPSQTVYLGRDRGVNAERARAAEAAVRALREEGRLPLPDASAEDKARMAGTLDWPPQGSPGTATREPEPGA